MKKSYLILAIVFFCFSAQGQDIDVNFTADKTIDNVKATNLTTNESITMPGDETLVLHSVATGIDESISENSVWVAPNPYNSHANLHIANDKLQKVTILMSDMSGRVLVQYEKELNIGIHSFQIAAEISGVYLLSVKTESGINCLKIIQAQTGQNKIEYRGRAEYVPTILKSASADYVLNYTSGDIISYTITSGDFTTIINETPTESKTITVEFVECKDADANNYPVVKIGSQTWMAENLKVTHYPDGTDIPLVTDKTEWYNLGANNTDDAYCYYNNNANGEKDIYGALYTYAAAIGDDWTKDNNENQGVCPDGWHLPSDAEWTTLTDYLGGTSVAGGKMKETGTTHWKNPNTAADNSSGFTALPGGFRSGDNGLFNSVGEYGVWWSSTESYASLIAYIRYLGYDRTGVTRTEGDLKDSGYSVRCIRD